MKQLTLFIKNCEGCIYCNLAEEFDEKTGRLKYFCSEQNEFIPDPNSISSFCKLEDE